MTDSQSLKTIIETFRLEMRAEFAEAKNELKLQIRRLRFWIVITFFAGGGLNDCNCKSVFFKIIWKQLNMNCNKQKKFY